MSLPPAPVALTAAVPIVINPIEQIFMTLNTNPYFIGLMMLLLNLGGRFIGMEISKEQEKVFTHPWVRRGLIFTVLFVATRNVVVALIMTIFVLLLLSFLFNENSDLYLWGTVKQKPDQAGTPGMTPEETEIFRRLNEKYQRVTAGAQKKEGANEVAGEEVEEEPKPEQIYKFNLQRLFQ